MTKKRILCWLDSPTIPTGFGNVAKNLLRDLHKTYDVSILGINYKGLTQYDTSKYFIYPVDPTDLLGIKRFEHVLRDAKPDLIFLFQDQFHINTVLPIIKQRYSQTVPIMIYTPIDGRPISQAWKSVYSVPDKIIMYTDWARQAVYEDLPEFKNKPMEVLYHGVEQTSFNKLPNGIIKKYKEDRGWGGKFVLMSNNRYQPRKALPLLLRAVSLFQKGYKKCSCGNWYLASREKCDLNYCLASSVTEVVPGTPDTLLYVHANHEEYMMGPGPANVLQAHMLNAGFTDNDVNKSVMLYGDNMLVNPLSENELNYIYNAADVNVSTALGEGWGLSLIEAMAAGTPSIAPSNSAIPEVLGGTGTLVNSVAHFNMAMDSAHMRPVVDVRLFIEALRKHYDMWVNNGRKKVVSEAGIERVNALFKWDDKRALLEKWAKELL